MVLFDEMYIQKGTQFHGGKHTGADEDGNFFKGVACFMVVSLKRSVPIVVKAVPETSVSGNFIAENLMDIIAKHVLNEYLDGYCLSCIDHADIVKRAAVQCIINIYNNKQKAEGDIPRKDNLKAFKKRQRCSRDESCS